MYTPASFREPDPGSCFHLIERFGFATLGSWSSGEPMITHLPLLLDRGEAPGKERLLGRSRELGESMHEHFACEGETGD